MYEQIRYDRSNQSIITSCDSIATSDSQSDEFCANGNGERSKILCTHDGILLKHASAEFIADLNTSGALSLVEYLPSKRLAIEWRPNDNILITDDDAQDHDEWALVDTITRRQRTISECKVFNTKCDTPRCFRSDLEYLKSIEVMYKGQAIRLKRKSDGEIHSEFFFQHGNADNFVRSMQHYHILDTAQNNRREFEILNVEAQKLKKTFAELQLDDIKASTVSTGSWLPNKFVEFLVKVPDYVTPPHLPSPRSNKSSPVRNDEYEVLDKEKRSSEEMELSSHAKPVKRILPERKIPQRGAALSERQWREFQTEDGRISDPTRIKEIIFKGGISGPIRCEVWKYLLDYYQWEDTTPDRLERRRKKSAEYYQMKAQWLSMTTTQETNFTGYRDRKCQIDKDVKRTDRSLEYFAGEDNHNLTVLQDILMTYVMYNFDLGYVQGMSDLLAPILSIQQNEVDAFWCFVGFMDLVFSNFDIDQAGMKLQLGQLNRLLEFGNPELFEYLREHGSENMYFCFRWLLVWYKREFSNDNILELWECLWTGIPCPNYHLFVGVAILDQETKTIIDNEYEFTEILKHINELSMSIDLRTTLELAEAIYEQIKHAEELTNDIRLIIGEEPIYADNDEAEADRQQDFDDSFDDIVRELTPEESQIRQQKLEEACDQSMFLSFM